MTTIRFGCCLCDQEILDDEGVRLVVLPTASDEGWQQWWAHGRCFFMLMHPRFREVSEEFERFLPDEPPVH